MAKKPGMGPAMRKLTTLAKGYRVGVRKVRQVVAWVPVVLVGVVAVLGVLCVLAVRSKARE